ncbi:WD repeat-containing protein 20 isoform 2-T2 [Salvelinus alpinus]
MAAEGGGKEISEIKTQFTTREGVYKLLTHSEYSRPNRVPFNSQGSNPVKVSFVNVNDQSGNGDRICFNVGRELYFYIYKGVRKAADKSNPIDKRIYKLLRDRRNGTVVNHAAPCVTIANFRETTNVGC